MPKRKFPVLRRLVYSTQYRVARVVTLWVPSKVARPVYRSYIRFEGGNWAIVESRTKVEAQDAHDVLGAYCLGLDEQLETQVARARANALAEIRALLANRPIERAAEVEQARATDRRKAMIERNRPPA